MRWEDKLNQVLEQKMAQGADQGLIESEYCSECTEWKTLTHLYSHYSQDLCITDSNISLHYNSLKNDWYGYSSYMSKKKIHVK